MEVGLSLGANLGNRLLHLQTAKKQIISAGKISFITQSPVYETEPVGVSPDDCKLYFLNAVIIIETALPVPELIARFQSVEHELGRRPTRKSNASRPIDIDIIYADNLRIELENIIIPHPRWFKRRFVVQPLSDVRPDLVIPPQTITVHEILRDLSDQHRITLLLPASEW